jgi:hypothetical protein
MDFKLQADVLQSKRVGMCFVWGPGSYSDNLIAFGQKYLGVFKAAILIKYFSEF